jgi:hypothetical protein
LFAFGKIIAYYMGMNSDPIKPVENRNSKGQFTPGNNANPNGRPKAGTSIAERIRAALSEDDWTAIIAKATEQAMAGDKAARDFLLDRTEGKPNQKVEIEQHDPSEVRELG